MKFKVNFLLLVLFLLSLRLTAIDYNSNVCAKLMGRLALTSQNYIDSETDVARKISFEETKRIAKELLGLDIDELFKDNLTGLPNRHAFDNEAPRIFEMVKRGVSPGRTTDFIPRNSSISIIMSDLDNFKLINDVFGHDNGDLVLKMSAKIIQKVIRKTDFPVRFGGEEIFILLPYTQKEEASFLADRIRKSFIENKEINELFEKLKKEKLEELEHEDIVKVAKTLETLLGRKISSTIQLRLRIEDTLQRAKEGVLGKEELNRVKKEFIDEIQKRLPSFQTVSLGVSTKKIVSSDLGTPTLEKLLKTADIALNKSKEDGRNKVTYLEFPF